MSDLARYIVLNKAVGETPLSCVEAWREKHPAYAGVSLAYAGRLDPMASGKLLILIGEECKQQERYHDLDKEYTFRVLFGVSSDSGDVLGLVSTENSYLPTRGYQSPLPDLLVTHSTRQTTPYLGSRRTAQRNRNSDQALHGVFAYSRQPNRT
jgi:hypothetical protein